MERVYNFSAGPAMLPDEVMREAQAEFLDYQGSGMSVMELSHRGKAFTAIAEQAEADLRELMGIPDDYAILFMQGGATGQFAGVPLNLAADGGKADYFLTGQWSAKAVKEAGKFVAVNRAVDTTESKFTTLPEPADWKLDGAADFVHLCSNETIAGVQFDTFPDTGDVPLVADMSSDILSREIDVRRFGVIYAGAQKNIGPAGVTVVIVRKDLLGRSGRAVPMVLDYAAYAESNSMANTPPTFAWYMAAKVFAHLKADGGVAKQAERNRRKAESLYALIDGSDFYHNPVAKHCRSVMNIPFVLADSALDETFLREADAAGLTQLKGHRSVGGMRASIYNAMPEAGVKALAEFMQEFARTHG